MSHDFNAYLRSERFPTLAVIREHLQRAGGRVLIADEIDFTNDTGHVAVMLDGAATGFELYSSAIDDDCRARYRARLERAKAPPDEYLSILESCDFDLNFNCNAGDEREVTAARIVMTAIVTAANGWFCDPQTGTTVRLGQENDLTVNFRARFSYGNPHAPFGIGAYTVTVGVDDNVELVHERGGKRRRWVAHAEPALATTLAAGLKSASFPAPPSEMVGRAGASGFAIEVPRPDGTIERASGFPSRNYRDVSLMFSHIVSQMSGDEVLGFSMPKETRYVSDAKETE